MTELFRDVIPFPRAWRSAELEGGKAAIARDLTDAELAALDDAMAGIAARGLDLDKVEKEHFAQSALTALMSELYGELMEGKGIVLLRGFPTGRYSEDEIGIIYWGLGCHLGIGLSQSVMGDRLGHVVNVGGKDPRERAYRNSRELSLHTDTSDIVSLCCLQKSKVGGESIFASALAVHNEMLEKHPELLEALYEGFYYHRFGEQGPDQEPITPYRVPHFSCLNGQVSLRYVRQYVELAAEESGQPLTDLQVTALDTFDAIARRDDMKLEFTLESGEAIFLNNLTVMHARRGFEDGKAAREKRHLLRLWIDAPGGRHKVPEINIYGDDGGIGQVQDRTSPYYRGQTQPSGD